MNALVIATIFVSALFYGAARSTEALWKLYRNWGSVWDLRLDPDTHLFTLKRVKPKANDIPEKERIRILDGSARWGAEDGGMSLFMSHKKLGTPLGPPEESQPGDQFVGPSMKEIAKSPRLRVLTLWNPEIYYHATKHNDARDTLEANRTENEWWIGMMPVVVILVFLMVIMMGFLIYKIGTANLPKAGAMVLFPHLGL